MALSFIGEPISLISHSDVRYRGILAGIDPRRVHHPSTCIILDLKKRHIRPHNIDGI
ncbi:hypothetical protein BDZ89DRAFT_1061068 [Hymenopellis radicata]|nr:hypothetical protein BDZ89DRAFT_1061068 [Hymenopellis radicata]